jgi:outer membrane protein OmpA-like peptidoglycan-associated protein
MTRSAPRRTKALLAAILSSAIGGTAAAQTDGWYAGAEAGATFAPKIQFHLPDGNAWTQKQDFGYAVSGQVGYAFGPVRVEGELSWRQNDLDKINDNFGTYGANGNINALGAMANVYYDIYTGTKFTPYIGAGVGALNLGEDRVKANGVLVTDDSDLRPGYQGIAGVSYAVDDQLSIKADYHYTRADQVRFTTDAGYDGGAGRGTYQNHAVMVGFTWHFAAPPKQEMAQTAAAPVPPTPAPAPAAAPKTVQAAPIPKNFMIFFDFDKSELTPEAKSILTQSVDAAKKQNATGFDLTGYTDTVGSAQYNQKLSERRAESAKKFLISLGVPANQIATHGKGKNDLLVPTKDGVREAQNRRVTITLE